MFDCYLHIQLRDFTTVYRNHNNAQYLEHSFWWEFVSVGIAF